jgi:tRNA-binding EMAP/Myf-like protein
MKKLLLGLGTVSLAILPVAAMVSCSSTPSLDEQISKLNISVGSKIKDATTITVATEINTASDAIAKLAIVEKFANLPKLADGFTLEVKTAEINGSTVEIKITVTEIANTNSKDTIFTIKELVSVKPTLETEFNKININRETIVPIKTATAAAASIIIANDKDSKEAALKLLVDLPILADGFTLEVKSVKINSKTKTSVDVLIVVTETSNIDTTTNSKDATLTITGLTISPSLSEQLAIMNVTLETKINQTTTLTVDSINNELDMTKKIMILKTIVDLPILADGFIFEISTSEVDKTNKRMVNVGLKIIEIVQGADAAEHGNLKINNLIAV